MGGERGATVRMLGLVAGLRECRGGPGDVCSSHVRALPAGSRVPRRGPMVCLVVVRVCEYEQGRLPDAHDDARFGRDLRWVILRVLVLSWGVGWHQN